MTSFLARNIIDTGENRGKNASFNGPMRGGGGDSYNHDWVASFMRCSMKTRRLTSSVKIAWPCVPSVVLCVTEGLSFDNRNRASDLCWSHTIYLKVKRDTREKELQQEGDKG